MHPILPLLLALTAGADPAGPLTAATPVVDVGEVRSGPPLVRTFELTHSGSGTLTVSGTDTGCGCIKAELEPKLLQPGQTAKLTVTVNTLAMAEGPLGWPATVKYAVDGGKEQSIKLKLTGTLVREVSVNPPYLAVSTTGAVTQTVTVTDRRGKPLTVTKAAVSNAAIAAEVQAAKAGSQAVTVSIPDSLKAGRHEASLTLTTDDPACPQLVVPLTIHRRSATEPVATPGVATVRFAKDQATASALVQIRCNGKPVAVNNVESGTAGVAAKFSTGSGDVATVRVVVTADQAGAAGRAEVTVKLADPAGGVVVIPVVWYAP